MKIAIRYFSKSGNTKKLADAISEVTGASSETVDVPVEDDVDILFLGSAVYAAGVDDSVKKFIETLDPAKIKNVVCFSTAALMPSTYSQVSKMLSARNIPVDSREFHCRGAFKLAHKGRPNDQDIDDLKSFIHRII